MAHPIVSPPALALHILSSVLPDFSRETILGDMYETFAQISAGQSDSAAKRWFWRETIVSFPGFAFHALQNINIRRQIVNENIWNQNWFGKQDSRLVAGIGFVALLPALVFVSLAMAWFTFGPASFASIPGAPQLTEWMETGYVQVGRVNFPIGFLILGSLLLTVLVTALSIVKVNIERAKESYRFTFTIKAQAWSIILAILVVMLGLGLDWLLK